MSANLVLFGQQWKKHNILVDVSSSESVAKFMVSRPWPPCSDVTVAEDFEELGSLNLNASVK